MSNSPMKKPIFRWMVLVILAASLFALINDMHSLAQITGNLENKTRIFGLTIPRKRSGHVT